MSHIVSSIHLHTFAGRTFTFATPLVPGGLHGGDQVPVKLSWAGGRLPTGVEFVEKWVPLELDTEAVAAVSSRSSTVQTGAVERVVRASPTVPTITATAPSSRTAAGSRTFTVTAPRQPGRYVLHVEMRDTGRMPLPAAQRVRIPSVEVRVWGDRAVSVD